MHPFRSADTRIRAVQLLEINGLENSLRSWYKKAKMNRRQSYIHIPLRHSRVIHYTGRVSEVETGRNKMLLTVWWAELIKKLNGQQTAGGKRSKRGEKVDRERETEEENSEQITFQLTSVTVCLNRNASENLVCIFLISTTMLASFAPSLLQQVQMRS